MAVASPPRATLRKGAGGKTLAKRSKKQATIPRSNAGVVHTLVRAAITKGLKLGVVAAAAAATATKGKEERDNAAPKGTQHDAAPEGTQHNTAPKGTQHDAAPKGTQHDAAPKGTQHNQQSTVVRVFGRSSICHDLARTRVFTCNICSTSNTCFHLQHLLQLTRVSASNIRSSSNTCFYSNIRSG
jgi:hypothetical protein